MMDDGLIPFLNFEQMAIYFHGERITIKDGIADFIYYCAAFGSGKGAMQTYGVSAQSVRPSLTDNAVPTSATRKKCSHRRSCGERCWCAALCIGHPASQMTWAGLRVSTRSMPLTGACWVAADLSSSKRRSRRVAVLSASQASRSHGVDEAAYSRRIFPASELRVGESPMQDFWFHWFDKVQVKPGLLGPAAVLLLAPTRHATSTTF